MLAFHWEIINKSLKKLQGVLHTTILAPLFFLKYFGSQNKEVKYSRHSRLFFPLFWVVTFTYYFSSIKEKYPTLYVISYCLPKKIQFTDTNE